MNVCVWLVQYYLNLLEIKYHGESHVHIYLWDIKYINLSLCILSFKGHLLNIYRLPGMGLGVLFQGGEGQPLLSKAKSR